MFSDYDFASVSRSLHSPCPAIHRRDEKAMPAVIQPTSDTINSFHVRSGDQRQFSKHISIKAYHNRALSAIRIYDSAEKAFTVSTQCHYPHRMHQKSMLECKIRTYDYTPAHMNLKLTHKPRLYIPALLSNLFFTLLSYQLHKFLQHFITGRDDTRIGLVSSLCRYKIGKFCCKFDIRHFQCPWFYL